MTTRQNMKICLINPPFDYPADANIHTYFNQPVQNLGLGYLASTLSEAGYEVDVIEAPPNNLSVQQCVNIMLKEQYALLGVSCHFYNRRSTIKLCKKYASEGGTGVVFAGGILASLYPEQLLIYNTGIKFCIVGEGEKTITDIANAYMNQVEISTVKGIVYLEGDTIHRNPIREPILDLDRIPHPRVTYLSPNKMVMLTTSRGCSGSCSFCAAKHYYKTVMGGQYFRKASAQYIIKEMSILYKKHGVRFFHFCDDNFLAGCNDDWMEEFTRGVRSIGHDIQFYFYACTNDILRLENHMSSLKEAGLVAVFVGVESFTQRQLDVYNKNTTPEKNIQALDVLISNGIKYNLGLMLLDPWAHLDEYITNVKTLYDIGYYAVDFPDACPVSLISAVHLVPNSDLYQAVHNAGLQNSSELGYFFSDSKVSMFYTETIPWQDTMQRMYRYFQYIFKYRGTSKEIVFKQFRHDIMKIDILFLLDLSTAINDGNPKINELVESYNKKVYALEKHINKYI